MRKIGIMGGTFDPIHLGHLIAAETARTSCGLDEVWFIPSFLPPLKSHEPGEHSELRLQMVQEAIKGNPHFRAMDIELARGGLSYSIDTVLELRQLHPHDSFSYIIGTDRINDLSGWHRIEELAERVAFIGLNREGTESEAGELPDYLQQRLTYINMPPIGISSTAIREAIQAGGSFRYLVPEAVFHFITGRGLYGARSND
ncbi:nicotinate (nicotinamide) nucleotide adenylyltransferase [Paenibacillus sp. BIHB 4019]|uniref:Probable nicotinate-nucleotide adenylyltransferase n=1 Tax=Paenibacillus sp. BIHB 4019 TaxID=1870819 RepID=A0A1B2DQX8_9BACL|nr:nicotinate-nucleotide adenylyltransferase [Paenibacillus sp. BIHB 4019]ANY70100.1 nicotinate (nicotinamide) nucleotide adenylyltransferase [Paenibacillus sp. BIHB 4019]